MPALPDPLDVPMPELSVTRLLDSGTVAVRDVECRGTCRQTT